MWIDEGCMTKIRKNSNGWNPSPKNDIGLKYWKRISNCLRIINVAIVARTATVNRMEVRSQHFLHGPAVCFMDNLESYHQPLFPKVDRMFHGLVVCIIRAIRPSLRNWWYKIHGRSWCLCEQPCFLTGSPYHLLRTL